MRNAPPRYHVVQKISAAVTSVVLAMGALAEGIGNRTFAIAPPSQPLGVPRVFFVQSRRELYRRLGSERPRLKPDPVGSAQKRNRGSSELYCVEGD